MDNAQEITLQWVKGDKIGNVEKVSNQDSQWTVFQSGSRIATGLINEFMIPLEGEPLDLGTLPEITDLQPPNEKVTRSAKTPILTKPAKENPIKTLFDKQKKTDNVDLRLTFSINVPTKDIFNIISMTFDEDEVIAELDSFISSQINQEILKDTLRTSIEELIKTRYKTNS